MKNKNEHSGALRQASEIRVVPAFKTQERDTGAPSKEALCQHMQYIAYCKLTL